MGVSLVATDLVHCALAEAHDVEGVKADVGVRDRCVDRLLVAAGQIDRDRPDRRLAVAEEVKELLQRLRVAAGCCPHDRAGLMVNDGREVPCPRR